MATHLVGLVLFLGRMGQAHSIVCDRTMPIK